MLTRRIARTMALAALAGLAPSATRAALPNGVAAGDTTATSAVLWARSTLVGPVRFELSERQDFSAARAILTGVTDPKAPAKLAVNGLKPATTYFYRATDLSGRSAQGQFRTAAVGEHAGGLSFGVSGDTRPELRPYPAVRNAARAGLEFFACLGDCIYAENYSQPEQPTAANLKGYRAKYIETLSSKGGMNTLKALRASTAHFATIDDHEVINDFSGGAAPSSDGRFDANGAYINETARFWSGLQAFQEYLPIADEFYGDTGDARDAYKRKLYRARQFGKDAVFVLLDERSFRDPPLASVANPADPAQVGAFMVASLTQDRTLLGARQLADLKADLKAAQDAGVVWKFVGMPEPIQNLGVVGAPDRFEGYAKERADLLRFINEQGIQNVVFISADIHGTLVNNLTYEDAVPGAKIQTGAFEITTGPIAFDEPFGPTVAGLAAGLGLLTAEQQAFYKLLPMANDPDSVINDKDDFVKSLVNSQVVSQGYDALGLEGSPIDAELLEGDYLATHVYGWTRFDIDGASKALTVTTYGVPAYDFAAIEANVAAIAALKPAVVSRFVVKPKAKP